METADEEAGEVAEATVALPLEAEAGVESSSAAAPAASGTAAWAERAVDFYSGLQGGARDAFWWGTAFLTGTFVYSCYSYYKKYVRAGRSTRAAWRAWRLCRAIRLARARRRTAPRGALIPGKAAGAVWFACVARVVRVVSAARRPIPSAQSLRGHARCQRREGNSSHSPRAAALTVLAA